MWFEKSKAQSLINHINKLCLELKAEGHQVKVNMAKYKDLLDIDFFVIDDAEYCGGKLFSLLSQKENAEVIHSLKLGGEDEGANGTKNWDLWSLTEGDAAFPSLKQLIIEKNAPSLHNRIIVTGNDPYLENGVLGKLLNKSPKLEYLSAPSAPDESFFSREHHPLKELEIQSGYDTQKFIANLANSTCFNNLKKLIFTDFSETYIDNYQLECTPVEDYLLLFETNHLAEIEYITIVNSQLNDSYIERIKKSPLAKRLKELKFEKEL